MSKEFKIANWKVEVDWRGMTLAPAEDEQISTASGSERRSDSGSIVETTLATARGTDTTRQGEYQVWV